MIDALRVRPCRLEREASAAEPKVLRTPYLDYIFTNLPSHTSPAGLVCS